MTLETLFSAVWEMSLTGAIVVVVVVLARLCLKRLPKSFSYALWALVLFRLLCPVSLSSPVSLFSVVKPLELPGAAKTERVLVEYFDSVPKDRLQTTYPSPVIVGDKFFTYPITAPTPIEETETFAFETVWLIGIAVGAVWGIVSSLRLRHRLIGSVEAEGHIRLADHIDTPFVFGLFRPKIYLPSDLNVEKQPHILRHEQYHIRRGDHVWRFLAYAALCIHWFNPLVWLAFYLSGKDMEMSCDEAVVREMGTDVRADYSASLLAFGTSHRAFTAAPIAFGEGSTKGRIKNLLRWKNPKLWLIVAAVVCCVAVAAVCLVDPKNEADPQPTDVFGYHYDVTEIVFEHGFFSSFHPSVATMPEYRIDADGRLWMWVRKNMQMSYTAETWHDVGLLTPVELTAENFANGFGPIHWFDASVTAEDLLAANSRAWVVDLAGDGLSYYLLEQTDGKLYLACWYDVAGYNTAETTGESSVLVRWVLQIERTTPFSAEAPAQTTVVSVTPFTTGGDLPADPIEIDLQTLNPMLSEAALAAFRQAHTEEQPVTHVSALSYTPDAHKALDASDVWLESHVILDSATKQVQLADGNTENRLIVYAEVLCVQTCLSTQGYPAADQIVCRGYHENVIVEFAVDETGKPVVKSFLWPKDKDSEDGHGWNEANYPVSVWETAKNFAFGDQLQQSIYSQIADTFQVDTDQMVANLLKKILAYPRAYGEGDYEALLSVREAEVHELIRLGHHTLRYCYEMLQRAETDRLSSGVMAHVCRDIMAVWGEDSPEIDETNPNTGTPWFGDGREWVAEFTAQAQALAQSMDEETLRTSCPGACCCCPRCNKTEKTTPFLA